jgi:uncharacterized protein
MAQPRVIYEPKPGSPIEVDRQFYDRLAGSARTPVERFIVPMRSGRAWPVRAGQIFRIVAVEGAQVADFTAWSSCTARTSPPTIGCGPACRICVPC